MVNLETNYLRIHWTNLHHVFRIGIYVGRNDQSDLLFAIA